VRWDSLRAADVPADPAASQDAALGGASPAIDALPLAFPDAVVRRFDTPAFAGMTFYEVRARSILNRVPGASRVPFEWTINPYRGCSHACTYCLSGETEILMADGRTRPLADVRVDDEIYGTVRRGSYRRYTVTRVLARWSSVKPAYRITLADGTALIASGDHRFLTERGWKHVTGQDQGHHRRPHLTTGNKLMGTGRFAAAPRTTSGYRRGYLFGLTRAGTACSSSAGFLLATVDTEAVDRVRRYLGTFDLSAVALVSQAQTADRKAMTAIHPTTAGAGAVLADLLAPPAHPGPDWGAGFLAGSFDADGSYARGILRISSADDDAVRRMTGALEDLDFDTTVESRRLPRSVRFVRVRGGLREHLRFFHLVDPAVSRKRGIADRALKTNARLDVISIESLGLELPLIDITTGTGDFIANGVVSHNCFARNTHTYLDFDAGHDFDTKVVVKVNAGELLRRELAAPKWHGDHIAMGTNVDCYQRAEGRYRLMPEILAALRDHANPFSILTKGTLILRDLDLLRQAAAVTSVAVSMSVGFVDEALWRSVEPGTPSPARRLDAVRQLADAGFAVGVLMAPILPALTDAPERIEATVRAIAAAGAASVVPLPLHLRRGAKQWYAAWLAREHPSLVPRYRELYGMGAYLPQSYQREVTARVRAAASRYGLDPGAPQAARQVEPARSKGPPPVRGRPEQLTLL
jgi:DNA repair photolyase